MQKKSNPCILLAGLTLRFVWSSAVQGSKANVIEEQGCLTLCRYSAAFQQGDHMDWLAMRNGCGLPWSHGFHISYRPEKHLSLPCLGALFATS